MTTKYDLILIDGSSYLYRAFYALPPLTNSKGQPTGAIYGVMNMIRKLIKDYQPESLACIFDAKGKTFRDELFVEYKATREPMPDDLSSQIEPLQALIAAYGIPLIIEAGVEADDVIATLALKAKKQGKKTLISTGDKDIAQIVCDDIHLINTMSNTLLDEAGVVNKFGVTASQIPDYLALVGDKIDNIPGVPSVGPKTAQKWLQQYQTLNNLLKHQQEISGKVGENLRSHLKELELSRKLVEIKTDVKLDFTLKDLKLSKADTETLINLLKELEFKSWLQEFSKTTHSNNPTSKRNYKTILTQQEFEHWLKLLSNSKLFSIDTETTSLDSMRAELIGISFCVHANEAAYLPLRHDYAGVPQQLDLQQCLKNLKPILENENILKCGHNLKYDKNVLSRYDIDLSGIAYDSMLESYILNPSQNRHDLDSLALKLLDVHTIHYEDVAGKGAKQIPFAAVNIEKATEYSAEDADIALQLHETLYPKIQREKKLGKIFQSIEMPLLSVLSRMEQKGVAIDVEKLHQQSKELSKKLIELEAAAHKYVGQEFNLNSPKQLQVILYEKLNLPIISKTPTGQPSTAENVLQELANQFELPHIILEYRTLSKLRSTYTDALPKQINPHTGRVHTSYNQAVTATGRLSSTDPNLQNIPIRTEAGRKIRQAFIAAKNHKILSADYSQIELRIMAHLSDDPGLKTAFANGHDIHRATAAEVFNIPLEKVTDDQRRKAKAINFGLIYGMSAFGLAKQINSTTEEAKYYIERYFSRYPNVHDYMEKAQAFAAKHGYVETLLGRKLYLPDINASNLQFRRAAQRAAINAPMQGTAADIIKLAMINIDKILQQHQRDACMIMQVHDELVFEVYDKFVTELQAIVEKHMSHVLEFSVPLAVSIGIGDNWDEAH